MAKKKDRKTEFSAWLAELAADGWDVCDRKGFGGAKMLWLRKKSTALGITGPRGKVSCIDLTTQRTKQYMSWVDFKAQGVPVW